MQEAGVPIGYSFEQNLLEVSWTGIAKGTRRRDAAMRLCAYLANPQYQAAPSSITGDTPTYPTTVAQVAPAARRWLPDLARPDNLFTDPAWWDTRLEELTLRFQDWLFT
jgi:putative spermidine/putrescine transport system substrate-binding protein